MRQSGGSLKASVIEYCTAIGADRLLVQGAGGNVSWKDADTLWVKASGTWLAEAVERDIFVPVDLSNLRTLLDGGNFAATPRVRGKSVLKPSIETLLHALMPHRVVIHLHAIEVLAHLVRDNCMIEFQSLLDESIQWAIIDYHKPGTALASAVSATLAEQPMVKVIFLKNHGVVIGGSDIAEVSQILGQLTKALSTIPAAISYPPRLESSGVADPTNQYSPVADLDIHQLALNTDLFDRLKSGWALYPDHVVFLGPRAYAYRAWEIFNEESEKLGELPELVFIHGEGVFVRSSFNKAKHAQLRCYYDVLTRQKPDLSIRALTSSQIAELLNWDAEQYRMNLAK